MSERGLIAPHVQQVIRARLFRGFGHLRLAEHGIAGDPFAAHRHEAQPLRRGLVLVGFGVGTHLAHHRVDRRREQGEQMNRGDFALARASRGLAIEGEVIARIGAALRDPIAEDAFRGVGTESPEEAGVGGGGGRLAASESEGVSERGAMIPPELRDGLGGGSSGTDGKDGEREDGSEMVNLALGFPRVEYTSRHLGESDGHDESSKEGPICPNSQLAPTSSLQ